MGKKISDAFAARLAGFAPDATVRAIVMIQTPPTAKPSGRRMTRVERLAAVEAIKESARTAIGEIDDIVRATPNGRRLSETAGAMGSIVVETTRAGLELVATLDRVKAILEDQPVSLERRPGADGQT